MLIRVASSRVRCHSRFNQEYENEKERERVDLTENVDGWPSSTVAAIDAATSASSHFTLQSEKYLKIENIASEVTVRVLYTIQHFYDCASFCSIIFLKTLKQRKFLVICVVKLLVFGECVILYWYKDDIFAIPSLWGQITIYGYKTTAERRKTYRTIWK